MPDIISSYTELQELLDDAVEGLKQVQDDLKWLPLIADAKMTLRNTVASRFDIMKWDIDSGHYETEVRAALTTCSWRSMVSEEGALSDGWS